MDRIFGSKNENDREDRDDRDDNSNDRDDSYGSANKDSYGSKDNSRNDDSYGSSDRSYGSNDNKNDDSYGSNDSYGSSTRSNDQSHTQQSSNQGGQKEDYLDKGLDYAEKKEGASNVSRDTNERITDTAREGLEGVTGRDIPDKFSN